MGDSVRGTSRGDGGKEEKDEDQRSTICQTITQLATCQRSLNDLEIFLYRFTCSMPPLFVRSSSLIHVFPVPVASTRHMLLQSDKTRFLF
jgi:hypothetical protein